jgi:hypothetical protein
MGGVKTYLEALMTLDEAPLKLEPGQVIFSAGEAGREMFIVRTGQRRPAHRRHPARDGRAGRHLRRAGPGRPRPAQRDARWPGPAARSCSSTPASFGDLVRRVPGLALEVMKVMARRLRRTNPTG